MQELFNQYVNKMYEFLGKYNFKKSGNNFYRKDNGSWVIINIQKMRNSDLPKFTLNIGVFSETLGDFYEFDKGKKPGVEDLHWVKRIGHFQPEKSDLWFEIEDGKQLQKVVDQSIGILNDFVLPQLSVLSNDIELEKLWLINEDSSVTEFQRLLNLTVLLSKRHSEEANKFIEHLKEYAKEKRFSIDYHLNKLYAEYLTE